MPDLASIVDDVWPRLRRRIKTGLGFCQHQRCWCRWRVVLGAYVDGQRTETPALRACYDHADEVRSVVNGPRTDGKLLEFLLIGTRDTVPFER